MKDCRSTANRLSEAGSRLAMAETAASAVQGFAVSRRNGEIRFFTDKLFYSKRDAGPGAAAAFPIR
jgi:hypothetical protein